MHRTVKKRISKVLRNPRDSKNGVNYCQKPWHHIYIKNPLKILNRENFKISSWKFFETCVKLIFSVSLITWKCQNSLNWRWPYFRTVSSLKFQVSYWIAPLAIYLLKLSCDAAAAAGSRIVVGLLFLPQKEFTRSEPVSWVSDTSSIVASKNASWPLPGVILNRMRCSTMYQ